MVKVGDKIRILFDGADHANVQRGDEFVVCEVFGDGGVRVDGEYNWLFNNGSYEVIHATPPEKVTHNGYEYSLVGPVKPEWLVDGAWVVDKETGEKRVVKEERPGVFNLCTDGLASIRYYDGLRNQYRPHEPKDWKWGDWAMYRGKRVFVMTNTNNYDCVSVSYPDIYPLGANEANRNFLLVKHDELTPTF